MPLRKLWNSLCGNGSARTNRAESKTSVRGESDGHERAPQADCGSNQSPRTTDVDSRPAKPKSGKSLSRDDKKLLRRLEALKVQSVLEISVDDGNRSVLLMQKLTGALVDPVHYIAVDQFELGPSGLTLRQFHQDLRQNGVTAQLVPMPPTAGLGRVLRTFGQVDAVIWGGQLEPNPDQRHRLARLSKPATVLFTCTGNGWVESSPSDNPLVQPSRAA